MPKRKTIAFKAAAAMLIILSCTAIAPAEAVDAEDMGAAWLNDVSTALDISDAEQRMSELHRIADMVETEYGEQSPEFAEMQMQIGVELHADSLRMESVPYILRSAQIYNHVLGDDSPVVATAYHSLADAEFSALDNVYSPEAEQAARIALEIRERIMASDAPERLAIASVLGRILTERGDNAAFSEARRLLRYAMNGFEPVFADYSGEYAGAYEALADLEMAAGDPNASLTILDEAANVTNNAFLLELSRLERVEQALRQAGREEEADALRKRMDSEGFWSSLLDEMEDATLLPHH